MNQKIKDVHEKCIQASRQFKEAQTRLISLLQELDQLKGFRNLGHKSLHDYVTKELKLSDDVAYTLISLARKSKEVPALKTLIESETIGITHARMIAPILNKTNQDVWLEKAEKLSKRELEKEIRKEFPERAVEERARYITDTRMELKFGVSEKLMEKLKRIQDLECKRTKGVVTLEQALEVMAELYLGKNDPVRKAERSKSISVPGRKTTADPSLIGYPIERTKIPMANLHAVNQRDQGKCRECGDARWSEIHHITPISHGGTHALENLVTLCAAHHRIAHASRAGASGIAHASRTGASEMVHSHSLKS